MGAKLEVDCNAKQITVTQILAVDNAYTLREISDMHVAYDLAFNGPVLGGFRFKYCDCEVRFVLQFRNPPPVRGVSDFRKGAPLAPRGGGLAVGPPNGGPDHTITVSPQPNGVFDWGTAIDELGHDLGITDPLGRTWYWRGRGGAGVVQATHIEEMFRNGSDNRAHFPPPAVLQTWRAKAACCCRGVPRVVRLSDEEALRESLRSLRRQTENAEKRRRRKGAPDKRKASDGPKGGRKRRKSKAGRGRARP